MKDTWNVILGSSCLQQCPSLVHRGSKVFPLVHKTGCCWTVATTMFSLCCVVRRRDMWWITISINRNHVWSALHVCACTSIRCNVDLGSEREASFTNVTWVYCFFYAYWPQCHRMLSLNCPKNRRKLQRRCRTALRRSSSSRKRYCHDDLHRNRRRGTIILFQSLEYVEVYIHQNWVIRSCHWLVAGFAFRMSIRNDIQNVAFAYETMHEEIRSDSGTSPALIFVCYYISCLALQLSVSSKSCCSKRQGSNQMITYST